MEAVAVLSLLDQRPKHRRSGCRVSPTSRGSTGWVPASWLAPECALLPLPALVGLSLTRVLFLWVLRQDALELENYNKYLVVNVSWYTTQNLAFGALRGDWASSASFLSSFAHTGRS